MISIGFRVYVHSLLTVYIVVEECSFGQRPNYGPQLPLTIKLGLTQSDDNNTRPGLTVPFLQRRYMRAISLLPY